jgi:hypothetical protein
VGGAFSEILKCHFQIEGPWGQLGKVTLRVKCSITMSINNACIVIVKLIGWPFGEFGILREVPFWSFRYGV